MARAALTRVASAVSRASLAGAARGVARPSLARPFATAAPPPWLTPGGQLGIDEDEDYMVYPRERPGARIAFSARGEGVPPPAPDPHPPGLASSPPPARETRLESEGSLALTAIVGARARALRRAGKDYALNWSLNRDGVTPAGDAYRFTKAAAATKMLGAAPPAAKKAGAAPPDAGSDALSFEAFDAAYASVVERFEAPGRTLYVADGDAPKTRTQARVVSDDLEAAASAMCHALERMPLRAPQGGLPVTAYVAPHAAEDFAGVAYEESDSGETKAKIVLTGKSATPAAVVGAIGAAAAGLAEEAAAA